MIFGEDNATPQGNDPQGHAGGAGQQGQQVRLDASRMETIFANFFALAASSDEVTIYLGANSPMPGNAQPLISMSHRVMMSPSNAKRLMMALQQTVQAHEERFGPIEVAPPKRQ